MHPSDITGLCQKNINVCNEKQIDVASQENISCSQIITQSTSQVSVDKSPLDESLDDFQESQIEKKLKLKKKHEKEILTCIVCQKDLTQFNLNERSVHVNQCIDGQSSASEQGNSANTFILEYHQSSLRSPQQKKFVVKPKSAMESDIQLAKALSLSLKQNENQTHSNVLQTDNGDIKTIACLQTPLEFQNPGKAVSKKAKLRSTPFLLLRTEEERQKIIMEKVNAIIASTSKAKTEEVNQDASQQKV
ncbi:BTB domain-containing protein [Caerostris extrusa]|uniref:BTB domain-containing protein n=1 Tax=Caerostris extrusa TaxID=172846 RepID=A0AAV4XNK4_CAEEX|nr:BTB domain-containing protein [Caerostris extrusa]